MNETNSSTKTKVIAIFVIMFLVALGLGVMYSRNLSTKINESPTSSKNQVEKENSNDSATLIPSNEPTLSLGSTSLEIKNLDTNPVVGTPFRISVNTSGTSIVSADFILKYDPTVLEFINADKGKMFDLILKNTSNPTKGEVKLSSSIAAGNTNQNNSGEAMLATFKPLKLGSTKISIDTEHTITALKGQNILNKSKPIELTVNISQ